MKILINWISGPEAESATSANDRIICNGHVGHRLCARIETYVCKSQQRRKKGHKHRQNKSKLQHNNAFNVPSKDHYQDYKSSNQKSWLLRWESITAKQKSYKWRLTTNKIISTPLTKTKALQYRKTPAKKHRITVHRHKYSVPSKQSVAGSELPGNCKPLILCRQIARLLMSETILLNNAFPICSRSCRKHMSKSNRHGLGGQEPKRNAPSRTD